ncbi:MAG: hybrid sensor histidine kinase/response regulator [Deltaproteobacteria bacterium]
MSGEKISVLLVDDQPILGGLEAPDREIVVARDSAEGLRVLAGHDVAVVVLASHLDGFATAAAIKASERTRYVPIIVVVGEADLARVAEAYEAGAVDVLERPVDAAVLAAKVAAFVALYRARETHFARLQRQFLATLGEELRPPLNVILGWIRMLRDGSIREAQRARALETVERNAAAQLGLIEELIDLSKMTSGTLTLELGSVDVRSVVEATVEAVRPSALDKQVTLFAALDEDVQPLSGDAQRLRQIVHELVNQAVTVTPTEGVVTVSLQNVGPEVELAITDTGVATGAELAGGVLDRLAIVRHLVELHDGTIRVESAEPDLGNRCIVTLPAAGRLPRTDDEVR